MDFLEVFAPAGRRLVSLGEERLHVGRAPGNDVAVPDDATMSASHAVFERTPTGWAVRDTGSRNGTSVNGERIWGQRSLRADDELRLGVTRVVYRSESPVVRRTLTFDPPPALTRREAEVLRELCRPLASGEVFTEPASIRTIAQALVVTEAAIKQHLVNLYGKFEIFDDSERRRLLLANQAVARGAVTVAELRQPGGSG